MPCSWSICLDERSDFLWFTCIWCKLPPWIRESLFLLLWNHPKSVMHVRSILWVDRLIIFIPYVSPSTPSHWLICSRRRSFFIRANHMTYVRTSISPMMVPNQNSVVFYHKTTMWLCLSWTSCSHACSRTSSCFGACYRSSSLENLATSSRRLVLQPFFSRHVVWNILTPTRSESQADMMVGTSPKNYNIGHSITGEVDVVANTPSRKAYYCIILFEEVGHLPIRIS